MAKFEGEYCQKCGRPTVVPFSITPEAAWTTVVLNRWHTICAGCFDLEAHKAGARVQRGDL